MSELREVLEAYDVKMYPFNAESTWYDLQEQIQGFVDDRVAKAEFTSDNFEIERPDDVKNETDKLVDSFFTTHPVLHMVGEGLDESMKDEFYYLIDDILDRCQVVQS